MDGGHSSDANGTWLEQYYSRQHRNAEGIQMDSVLRYIRQITQETSGEVVYGLDRQPLFCELSAQRLSRGFNDADECCKPVSTWYYILCTISSQITFCLQRGTR